MKISSSYFFTFLRFPLLFRVLPVYTCQKSSRSFCCPKPGLSQYLWRFNRSFFYPLAMISTVVQELSPLHFRLSLRWYIQEWNKLTRMYCAVVVGLSLSSESF